MSCLRIRISLPCVRCCWLWESSIGLISVAVCIDHSMYMHSAKSSIVLRTSCELFVYLRVKAVAYLHHLVAFHGELAHEPSTAYTYYTHTHRWFRLRTSHVSLVVHGELDDSSCGSHERNLQHFASAWASTSIALTHPSDLGSGRVLCPENGRVGRWRCARQRATHRIGPPSGVRRGKCLYVS